VTESAFLILEGLSAKEKLQLLDEVGEDHVRFDASVLPLGYAGDPATIAIIVLSQAALLGLSWYLRRRSSTPTNQARLVIKGLSLVGPGGRVIRRIEKLVIRLDQQGTEADPNKVIQVIQEALNQGLGGDLASYM
jgi:hypothetical protein